MLFPIPPRTSLNKAPYAYWEGFLSEEELTYLDNLEKWADVKEAQIRGDDGFKVDNDIRVTKTAWVYPNDENRIIWEKMAGVVAEVNRQFFRFDLSGFYEPMQLGLYEADAGGHYDWHIDSGVADLLVPRKLSMALLLSDPSTFEGGELLLKTENDDAIAVEQKRGRAWFFPSYVLHKVTPVTKGVRKSVVTWVGGPEFK